METRLAESRGQINNENIPKRKRKSKKVSPEKLKMANEVRMWLRVITMAELADKNGTSISPNKLNGTWRANSNLDWPDMPEPNEKCGMRLDSY